MIAVPRFLTVSRLHIVAIAAMGAFTFGWLLTGLYPWSVLPVVALDWFLVNLLNRVVDVKEDRVNQIPGADWADRHRRSITVGALSVLAASFVITHLTVPALTPLRAGYHALGLAYNWRLLPGGRRLKELYLLKNSASAVGFVITVFGYPLAAAGWSMQASAPDVGMATAAVTIAWFFLFELSYEVIYDLRDTEGDAAAGVRTFSVVHGVSGAARIIDGLAIASVVVLSVGFALGAAPWRLFVMGLAPLLQLVVYRRWLVRGVTAEDCVNITWTGVALLGAWHVWILVGLPGATA
jgi:4-hydroxybenzoate polyprenyltransferase